MAGELCASLRAHGRSGRTIGIKVRLDDFPTVTRARTVAAADLRRRARQGASRCDCWTRTRRRGRCGCWGCASRAWASRRPAAGGEPGARSGPTRPADQLALPV